jgi:hypothetical protein
MPKMVGYTKATCCGGMSRQRCRRKVRYVEHVKWSMGKGISFFYYCATCWRTPGPYGETPEERDRKEAS